MPFYENELKLTMTRNIEIITEVHPRAVLLSTSDYIQKLILSIS